MLGVHIIACTFDIFCATLVWRNLVIGVVVLIGRQLGKHNLNKEKKGRVTEKEMANPVNMQLIFLFSNK